MIKERLRENDARAAARRRRVETVDAILDLRVGDVAPADEPRLWAEVVEPDFELKLPHTPYRSFAPYEQTVTGRTVSGVEAAIADVQSAARAETSSVGRGVAMRSKRTPRRVSRRRDALEEDAASSPTPQKSSKAVLASSSSVAPARPPSRGGSAFRRRRLAPLAGRSGRASRR